MPEQKQSFNEVSVVENRPTSEKHKKFADALDALIKQGERLRRTLHYECRDETPQDKDFRETEESVMDEIEIETLPSFQGDYQAWYTEARSLIKQILPDQLSEFESYYKDSKPYEIRKYLLSFDKFMEDEHDWEDRLHCAKFAFPAFQQQLGILKAARNNLDSILVKIKDILQFDLFDSELDSARGLVAAGHLRAAGVICGVVIEKHLWHVCDEHGIEIEKEKSTISDLNEALRRAGVTDNSKWRFIQYLADIRNKCGHDKGEEPTREEVERLLSETAEVTNIIH